MKLICNSITSVNVTNKKAQEIVFGFLFLFLSNYVSIIEKS